jgi:hypothetical protein
MKSKYGTDKIIAQMMEAGFAKDMGIREKYLFRETLHNLVRLAKSEQMKELKQNVKRLTSPVTLAGGRAITKGGRHGWTSEQIQQQFEFNRLD